MDKPMNTKIRTILAAGMLLATVLPVAACAKKAPSASTVPAPAETAITETAQTEQTAETAAPAEQTETAQETTAGTPIAVAESVESVQNNEQTATVKTVETTKKTASKSSKKTTKKTTTKTTKKTTKTTVKETKATSADKANDKTTKETAKTPTKNYPENYSLGSSTYVCKDITIKMFIKKNDNATISVTYKSQDRNDRRREVYYTMSGKVDRKTNTMKYTNCTKQELVYTDLGLLSNKVDYKNGKGEISFKKDYKLVWTDSMQHFADSLTFSRTA